MALCLEDHSQLLLKESGKDGTRLALRYCSGQRGHHSITSKLQRRVATNLLQFHDLLLLKSGNQHFLIIFLNNRRSTINRPPWKLNNRELGNCSRRGLRRILEKLIVHFCTWIRLPLGWSSEGSWPESFCLCCTGQISKDHGCTSRKWVRSWDDSRSGNSAHWAPSFPSDRGKV